MQELRTYGAAEQEGGLRDQGFRGVEVYGVNAIDERIRFMGIKIMFNNFIMGRRKKNTSTNFYITISFESGTTS